MASVYYLSFPLPLGDKCIQYSHFWRCISGYMVGESVLWQWAIIISSFTAPLSHYKIKFYGSKQPLSYQVLWLHSAVIRSIFTTPLSHNQIKFYGSTQPLLDQFLRLHSAIIRPSFKAPLSHYQIKFYGSTQPSSDQVLGLHSAHYHIKF